MPPNRHAVLSASSSHRWLHCNPSARLELEFEDRETEAAAEGTAAHALAEHKLRKALKMRSTRPVSKYDSDEMEMYTDGYLEFVLEAIEEARQDCPDPKVLIEQRLDFSCYVPDGFGTGDCLIVADKLLHIIDLKYGQGVFIELKAPGKTLRPLQVRRKRQLEALGFSVYCMSICIKDQIQNMNLVIGCTVGCTYCYARNNVKRWHMIDDFADPEFFPGKLKMMEKKRPQNFLLTGMSDLSGWKPEWRDEVFAKIRENPQHQFLFLTKRPDLLDFDTDLENAWFGVTVTRKAELWRIDALRKNVRAKHYHVTFEPLFDDPGTVDLSGINWIVVGTMTGAQSRKIHTEPEWAWSLADQAHKLGIPVLMKEDLVPIIGDENMIQEMPEEFNKVLEVQRSWQK